MKEWEEWLVLLLFFIGILNIGGFIMNIRLMYEDNDSTIIYQIWTNDMNLFGKILLTLICLIFFPIWTILEGLFRLLKWLCYVGKEQY